VTLTRARVPIIKFDDPQSKFSCDICVNNKLALHNTRLLSDYAKMDPRVRQLGYLVKYWAKQRLINEPYTGTLSSYAYILLVINFLQQRNPPIMPCLQHLVDPEDNRPTVIEVDGYNCYYYTKVDRLRDFGKANKETIGELFAAFFRLYAVEFNWQHSVVSVRTAGFLTKAEKEWTKKSGTNRDHFFFAIEDPFEITHNLGRIVDRESLKILRYEFRRAYKLVCKNADLSLICKKFQVQEEVEDDHHQEE